MESVKSRSEGFYELDLLSRVEKKCAGCTRCSLHRNRNKIVHWRGSPTADIALIGEAPGANEDKTGSPFVGIAGRELDSWLERSGINRIEDVFICNTVACRPPSNRNPTREEMSACKPRLVSMMKIVNPKVIVLLGLVPAKMVNVSVLKDWRGEELDLLVMDSRSEVCSWPAICTYHPAYILRLSVGDKKKFSDMAIEDLKMAKRLSIEAK